MYLKTFIPSFDKYMCTVRFNWDIYNDFYSNYLIIIYI